MEPLKFKPLHDHVLIEPGSAERKTETGLLVVEGVETHYNRGVIVAVPEFRSFYHDRTGAMVMIPAEIQVGEEVLYPARGVTPMRIEGRDVVLAKVGALVGIFA